MKDFLQDLVAHTHSIGLLTVKIDASEQKTLISSISSDQFLIMSATTHEPIANINGVFGMPNLNKLDLHLKCPEYKDNAQITFITDKRGDEVIPTGIHFQNSSGDFQNDYRLQSKQIVELKIKDLETLQFKWDVEFNPSQSSIQKLKYQAAAHSEQTVFEVATKDNNIVISFGDAISDAGSFVFHGDISGKLRKVWSFPKSHVISVLNLVGDKTMKITDAGGLQITVDSGIAEYNYTFPAH